MFKKKKQDEPCVEIFENDDIILNPFHHNVKEQRDFEEFQENRKKKKRILFIFKILCVGFLAFCVAYTFGAFSSEGGLLATTSSSSLEEIVSTATLTTQVYTYDSIATVTNQKGKELYKVAYRGTVKADLDFTQIKIDLDNKNKKITVKMPAIKLGTPNIENNSLDYIFIKSDKHYDIKVARETCQKHIEAKAKNDTEFLNQARANAENIVEGLLSPWIQQFNKSYTIEFI